MNKYEFANEEKSLIRHNLEPEMLIEVIKLDKPNDYRFGERLFMDDIFDEIIIKGWHFVFKIQNDEDFEDLDDYGHVRSILKRAGKWYKAKVVIGEIKLEKNLLEESSLEDDRFKLMKGEDPNWWLVAHKSSNIIIEFENGNFNNSKVSALTPISDFMKLARIMREVGDWLSVHHQNII